MTELRLEVGESRSSEQCKCICRLVINNERRGKLSLTRAEAKKLGRFLEYGTAHSAVKFSLVNLGVDK